MNRELWKRRSFNEKSPTQYPCPRCYVGILKRVWLKKEITSEGRFFCQLGGVPIEGIEHVFSGMLKCSDQSCEELVSFGGICNEDVEEFEEMPNGEYSNYYITVYEPKFFYPNLRLFKLPEEISQEIKKQIDLSFSHFFNDLSSSANRIRTTIEIILDEINAPNYHMPLINRSGCPIRNTSCSKHTTTAKRKKKKFRNLHQRIENYAKKKNKKVGNLLLANKIIGNEGSHIGLVELEDILDAYEILEEILKRLFIKSELKIEALAKEITTLNKPRSKK